MDSRKGLRYGSATSQKCEVDNWFANMLLQSIITRILTMFRVFEGESYIMLKFFFAKVYVLLNLNSAQCFDRISRQTAMFLVKAF